MNGAKKALFSFVIVSHTPYRLVRFAARLRRGTTDLFGLPFLFDSPQAAWQVVDGPIGDEVARQAQQRGLKVLAWWSNGLRQITNNVRPIRTPADMKGLKIRTPQDAVTIATMKALGANPTPLAFGELYVALKQGTVDGQENPIVNIVSSHLNEVQK